MTISRRSLFAALLVLPFARFRKRRAFPQAGGLLLRLAPPPAADLLQSCDALDWARAYVAYVKRDPAIATDEQTMVGWFANAIMRGYDERSWEHQAAVRSAGGDHVRTLTREAIHGAVARGWCADPNRHKEMDCDLAEAITQEILKLA
jgi:hypothetical protein